MKIFESKLKEMIQEEIIRHLFEQQGIDTSKKVYYNAKKLMTALEFFESFSTDKLKQYVGPELEKFAEKLKRTLDSPESFV